MMMADTMDPPVSDSVCRTQIITDEDQTLRLSPRKPAFRKDVVFEKVCCMPTSSSSTSSSSSVSISKSSPGMQCGRRKASTGSPTDGDGQGGCSGSSGRPPCRPPPSESQKASCGRGICFKDSPSPNENESNGIPGPTGEEVSSNEPLGEDEEDEEGARELTLGEESKLPDGVVNHSGSLSPTDRLADSDIIRRIKRGGGEGDDPSIISSSSGGLGIGDGGPRRASETINRPPGSSPATKTGSSSSRPPSRAAARALLVTDIDAVDGGGHLQAPSTAPSGRQERRREAAPRTPTADVLWEFNGRRLSNFCQNLMTECVSLDDEEEEEEEEGGIGRIVPLGSVATTRETCVDDDDYGSWGRAPGRPTTPISTVGDDGGGLLLSNRVPSSLGYSSSSGSRMDDSGMASTGTTGEDEITENVSIRDRNSNMSTQRQGITSENVKEKPSTKSAFTDARQESGTITPPPCDEKTSPGKTGKDSEAARQGGRRGRTMERGKYEASLLKDFIRPDQKKFSIAPSPLHQDFSLDVELAIWEASDFVPDRHASAPPAVLPMRLANSEDVLRSRQTSVSPQRQRPSGGPGGPRAGKGSKSVELLSVRHASPSGAKIRRRTLSKEWQVFTFTTREEITTLIRPKTANEESRVEEAKRDEHNPTGFQNCHPTESNETPPPPPKDSGAQRCTKTDDRFANTASEEEHLFIAESSSGFPSADLPKPTGVDQRLSPEESREKSEATLPLLCSTDSPDSTSGSDVWDVISGALSDAMRHVRWAESAAPFEKTKSLSAESTYDNMAVAVDGSSSELLLLSGSAAQSNNISSGNLSEPKEDNSEMCDQCDRNGSSPSMMEMDELVKALLDIANDNTVDSGASNRQKRPHATVNESASFCLFEMTTGGEFLESGNENDFPFSRHRANIPINDNNTQLRGVKVNRSAADNNNSSLIQNETDLCAYEVAAKGNNINTTATTTTTTTITTTTMTATTNTTHLNRNALSPEIESAFDKSVLDRINCSVEEDDDDLIAVENGDSILQISEELEIFEAGADPPLFDSAEFLERIPAEQQVVDRTDDSAADGDNSCRRRVASKENGAKEVTSSSSRRAAEESAAEVFPEKAFLESLFSSLGTIVFLLLAALIFHLLNRLVEHEL